MVWRLHQNNHVTVSLDFALDPGPPRRHRGDRGQATRRRGEQAHGKGSRSASCSGPFASVIKAKDDADVMLIANAKAIYLP